MSHEFHFRLWKTLASAPFNFIVVAGIKLKTTKCLKDAKLVPPPDILLQRRRDRLFLGLVLSRKTRLFD